jgi:hypothetical protein
VAGIVHPDAGGDDERAGRPGEFRAQGLNDAPVLLAIRREVRKVVVEVAVDHAVRLRRAPAQAVQVFQHSAMRLRAAGGERCGARI